MALDPKVLADYFIDRSVLEGRPLLRERIHSLIYFVYAWYGAETGIELFPMQAWREGPVAGPEVDTHIRARIAELTGTPNNR